DSLASYLDALERSSGFDLLLGRWNPDYDDPDDFTYGLFHSRAGHLRSYYSSEDLDRLIEEARLSPRAEKREAAYRRIDAHLLSRHVVLPLFPDVDYRLAGPRVSRLSLLASPPYVNYAEVAKGEAPPETARRARPGGIVSVPITGELLDLDPAYGTEAF